MKINKAVIAAAGWGTRFLPITKSMPKEMLPLLTRPIIQYSVEEAVACGAETIVIVTNGSKRAIEDYFDRAPELERTLRQKGDDRQADEIGRLANLADIFYIRQKEQLGLGHAVMTARKAVGDEPFMLILPDDLFELQENILLSMMDIYERYRGSVVAVARVDRQDICRYGIIQPEQVGRQTYRVRDFVEKPPPEKAPSDLAIMGRYVLSPEIFTMLEKTPPGRNQEIQLTDGLARLAQKETVYAYEFDGERYDAGTPLGWLETNIALALKDPILGPPVRRYLSGTLPSAGGKGKERTATAVNG